MANVTSMTGNTILSLMPEYEALLAKALARIESPEYQRELAEYEAQQLLDAHCARVAEYERHIERLSPAHVGFVRRHCGPDLMPLRPIPSIWSQLINLWDWSSSVMLVGPTGSQKTTCATWAGMWTACGGERPYHCTALRVATAPAETLEEWRGADLLILDELHRLQGQPEWRVGPVLDLIDHRYQEQLTTIACGTVDAGKITELVGAEVKRRFDLRIAL